MSRNHDDQNSSDEISIKDVIDFLLQSRKIILFTGLFGLLCGVGFFVMTPNGYEAVAQIQVAQFNTKDSLSPIGVPVEDPAAVIFRMKSPSSYSLEDYKICDLVTSKGSIKSIIDRAKFSVINGVLGGLELRVVGNSEESSKNCAQVIFERIRESQSEMIKPHIDAAKLLLDQHRARIKDVQSLVVRADKSGVALSAVYLSNRDELKFLADEITRLESMVMLEKVRSTKLLSPIYISDEAITAKKPRFIVVSLLAGLFFGVLLSLFRNAWVNYKK